MSEQDGWSYTEQVLHTLDEFTTAEGFLVKHHAGRDGAVGSWSISMKVNHPPWPMKGEISVWLEMLPTGWRVGTHRGKLPFDGLVGHYDEAEQALAAAKEYLRTREAAARLKGSSDGVG